MVKLIMGLKGSGKTKQFVSSINESVKNETGSMVCIENGKHLTYDIDYRVRLIDAKEYAINTETLLRGFISGMYAGNYDITHIFIDSLTKIVPGDGYIETEKFLDWLNKFGEAHGIKFTITISDDAELAPDGIKKYF